MSLQEQITESMKEAMKAKEAVRLGVLRAVKTAFTNELVATNRTPQDSLTDEEALAVITRESKKRKDAIQQFTTAGREELAADEKAELAVLETYLPKMMSKEEILKVVEEKKSALGVNDKSGMGQLIGAVMGELKGKADGGDVKEVVESVL